MRSLVGLPVVVAATMVSVACSSGGSASTASTTPEPGTSRTEKIVAQAEAASMHWTGSFQPVQQQTGSMAPRGSSRVFGNVTLSQSPASANRTRARISVSTQLKDTRQLRWALVTGRCGSADIPVLGVEQFPEITMSSSGRGELDSEVPVLLPQKGNYHVNVFFSNGADLSDVMTCANLKLERR